MLSKAGIECTMLAVLGLWSNFALATSDDATRRAAALFEQGVRQFSGAEYEDAAKAFLAADDLAPNTRALINGITAARRAGLHLLVAQAAERAIARSDMDAGGAELVREALAEATRNLTHVDVTCTPPPCTMTMDGAAIAAGVRYVLPGTHDFVGSGPDGASVAEHLSTVAGASYRITLTPKAPDSLPGRALVGSKLGQARSATDTGSEQGSSRSKPFSPGVIYAGAAGTAVLVGLTVWSGLETVSAKSGASYDSWEHVQDLALRTDLFLAGAIVLGAATTAAGLWGVDWGHGTQATALIFPGGGAAVVAKGRF
jgi:hypothetical protein